MQVMMGLKLNQVNAVLFPNGDKNRSQIVTGWSDGIC